MQAYYKTVAALTAALTVPVMGMVVPSRGSEAAPVPAAVTPPGTTIDAKLRAETLDGLIKLLNDSYVFPETAKKMEAALRERAKSGAYDKVTGGEEFARLLTEDLQAVSHDKHLRVRFSADPLPPDGRPVDAAPTAEEREETRRWGAARNFGFEKVERLTGNVGYMDLRMFFAPDLAGETCAAAMSFLANTDAVILDLRGNGGGEPEMVALVCSYFFGAEPVHLNDIYWRPTNKTQQHWTLSNVPGKRLTGKDVYVLTSGRTFSGAEECTYNLKNLKRATIVGETTGGGAHPGGTRRASAHFAAFVPMGRAISPITKTNWEGTGVAPDVAVPAAEALKVAHAAALRKIIDRTTDAVRKAALQQALKAIEGDNPAAKS
jgi:hypothetical protein